MDLDLPVLVLVCRAINAAEGRDVAAKIMRSNPLTWKDFGRWSFALGHVEKLEDEVEGSEYNTSGVHHDP